MIFYFAYGSNMSTPRLSARIPSARVVSVARLERHRLRFHMKSRDGSGKCDIEPTDRPDDIVYGVVYLMQASDKQNLDRMERLGSGYNEKSVPVKALNGEDFVAVTYYAIDIDAMLKPYHWYKQHVLYGAREHGLPHEYIQAIEDVESIPDPHQARSTMELSIYKQ